MRKLLKNAVRNRPFHPENARCARLIAWAILLFGILDAVRSLLGRWVVSARWDELGLPASPLLEPRWDLLLVWAVFLIFSEVFRRGAELWEQQRHTV